MQLRQMTQSSARYVLLHIRGTIKVILIISANIYLILFIYVLIRKRQDGSA